MQRFAFLATYAYGPQLVTSQFTVLADDLMDARLTAVAWYHAKKGSKNDKPDNLLGTTTRGP
jgi:hypothetical protein